MIGLCKPVIGLLLSMFVTIIMVSNSIADDVDVIDVVITNSPSNIKGQYRFSVKLQHPDSGWDHYADKWSVVGSDGTVYGTRVLAHPHVNEQPFTRSLDRVVIPENIRKVSVRGGDNKGSTGGKTITVDVPER